MVRLSNSRFPRWDRFSGRLFRAVWSQSPCRSLPRSDIPFALNRPDNHRTNSNTFACSLREFRVGGSHSRSAADVSRSECAVVVAKRGEPSAVGLKRDLQDGGGRRIIDGNPAGRSLRRKKRRPAPHCLQVSSSQFAHTVTAFRFLEFRRLPRGKYRNPRAPGTRLL